MPDTIIHIITNLYTKPQFYVNIQKQDSDYHEQTAGIRQGCPLSPYLFVMVMSALWHDIHIALPSTKAHELLYADDTLLYARTQQTHANTQTSRNRVTQIRPSTQLRQVRILRTQLWEKGTTQIYQRQTSQKGKTSQIPRSNPHRKSTTTNRNSRKNKTNNDHVETTRQDMENRQVHHQDQNTLLQRNSKNQTHVRTRDHVPHQSTATQTRHLPTKRTTKDP